MTFLQRGSRARPCVVTKTINGQHPHMLDSSHKSEYILSGAADLQRVMPAVSTHIHRRSSQEPPCSRWPAAQPRSLRGPSKQEAPLRYRFPSPSAIPVPMAQGRGSGSGAAQMPGLDSRNTRACNTYARGGAVKRTLRVRPPAPTRAPAVPPPSPPCRPCSQVTGDAPAPVARPRSTRGGEASPPGAPVPDRPRPRPPCPKRSRAFGPPAQPLGLRGGPHSRRRRQVPPTGVALRGRVSPLRSPARPPPRPRTWGFQPGRGPRVSQLSSAARPSAPAYSRVSA